MHVAAAPMVDPWGGDVDLAALVAFSLSSPYFSVVFFLLFYLLEMYVSLELFGCWRRRSGHVV
jgi:hypothetical protein